MNFHKDRFIMNPVIMFGCRLLHVIISKCGTRVKIHKITKICAAQFIFQ